MNVQPKTSSVSADKMVMMEKPTDTGYEHIVLPYVLMLPAMNVIAAYVQFKKFVARKVLNREKGKELQTNCWLVDGISTTSRKVKEGATTWQALDTVYNFHQGYGPNAVVRAIDRMWLHIRNAQAPRNRLAMAKNALRQSILYTASRKGGSTPVRILSLATGSGQGVIEVIAELRHEGIRTNVLMLDRDPEALDHAIKLAEQHGVRDAVQVVEGDVVRFRSEIKGYNPDIIEVMGLIDYFSDRLTVVLLKQIKSILPPNGFVFASNVHPNAESYFLKWVVNWDMHYRTRNQLADLMKAGGFERPMVETEPHGIQSFVWAQK